MSAHDLPLKCSLHDWGGLRSQLVYIFDGPQPNGWADGTYVRHREMSAWLLRRGWIHLEADGQEITVRPGQWLICTGTNIRQKLSHDASLLSLRMHHDWPNGSPLLASGPLSLFEAADHPELEAYALEIVRDVVKVDWGAFDRTYAFLWLTRVDYSAYARQQGHLLLFLGALAEVLVRRGWKLNVPAGVDSRLAQALFVMDTQDSHQPYPLPEMLKASGLTARKLNKICEKAYGLTTHAYWEKRRMERAQQALEGGFNIKLVASDLGFTQLSHFSAWFKRHTGLSPRAYRSKNRVEESA